eukprot:scaffold312357_cov31-Tisochrysis_lutea.AAC.2
MRRFAGRGLSSSDDNALIYLALDHLYCWSNPRPAGTLHSRPVVAPNASGTPRATNLALNFTQTCCRVRVEKVRGAPQVGCCPPSIASAKFEGRLPLAFLMALEHGVGKDGRATLATPIPYRE